jgi:hypothetical protein
LPDEACTPAARRPAASGLTEKGLAVTEAPMAKADAAQAMGPASIADSTWFRTWENTEKLLETACADLPELELP